MKYLSIALTKKKCPSCKEVGGLVIKPYQFLFMCNNCNVEGLNPFQYGPWEEGGIVTDTFKDSVVYNYDLSSLGPKEILDAENQNMLDFLKYLEDKKPKKESIVITSAMGPPMPKGE